MTAEYTHVYKAARMLPPHVAGRWTRYKNAKAQLRVEAYLHFIQGNHAPYFSVTGEIHVLDGRLRDPVVAAGCLHDDILHYFPKLAPVIALHLSDSDGVPMHAESNGWYWLAGYYGGAGERYHGGNGSSGKTPEECLQIFADHVRVPLEDARTLAAEFETHSLTELRLVDQMKIRRWLFAGWCGAQHPRWKAEAEAAIALLDQLAAQCPSPSGSGS